MTVLTRRVPHAVAAPAPVGDDIVGSATAFTNAVVALETGRTIVSAMTSLAGSVAGASGWSDGDRRALLADLDRVVDGLGVVRARVLVADRDAGGWQGSGDRSYEAVRARASGVGARVTAAQVRQAEHLAATPVAAQAVTEGRITLEHAAVLAKVAGSGTPAQQTALSNSDAQETLLGVAERQDAATFATTVARWAATVDPDGLERDHQAQRAQRLVHLTTTRDGAFLKGRLDAVAGHRLALALEALSPRLAADDDRDPGQRRADALDAMAKQVLAAPGTKPGGHVPPQITMVMSPETWAAARAERDRRRRSARDTGTATGSGTTTSAELGDEPAATRRAAGSGTDVGISYPPATHPAADSGTEVDATYQPTTLEDGTPVPVSEVAAAMCDCDLTALVMDAEGVPLDLRRTQRLYTGAQRKAVIARDRECGWPDCHAPARWCEIHHIAWWDRDNGPTSVDNGVLLCSFHHHETHRRDLTITRAPERRAGPSGAGGRVRTGAAPPGPLAGVTYDFRDRSGRRVGGGGDTARSVPGATQLGGPAPSDGTSPPSTAPPVTAWPDGAPPGCAPPGTASPAAVSSGITAGAGEIEWTTDPVTGARLPAFVLGAWRT